MASKHQRTQTPQQLLESLGATLLREAKHQVWLLPNRRTITLSKTASDHRAIKNQFSDIRREMRQ